MSQATIFMMQYRFLFFFLLGFILHSGANQLNGVDDNSGTITEEDRAYAERLGHKINFDRLHIEEYIRLVAKLANRNFVYTEPLDFYVTVIAEEAEDVDTILATLMQVLRIHGYAMLEQGGYIYIYKSGESPQTSNVILGEEAKEEAFDVAIVTAVIKLQNITPSYGVEIIRSMISPNAKLQASDDTHHLIITDIVANVKKAKEVLGYLDLPSSTGTEIEQYFVKYSSAEALIALASKVITPYVSPQPPPVFIPFANGQRIFIIGTNSSIQRAKKILRSIDIRGGLEDSPEGSLDYTKLFTYRLQYHKGGEIKSALEGVAKTLRAADVANADLVTTIETAQWIEASNSILFAGPRPVIDKVSELLRELDVPKKQVFIEVLVLQMSIEDSLKFGVDWKLNYNDKSSTHTASANPFKIDIIGKVLRKGTTHFLSIDALVEAVKTDVNSEIVINQKIMVSDMDPGTFGATESYDRSEETVTNIEKNTSQEKTGRFSIGNTLKIIPIVGEGGIVTLDITHNMSSSINRETNHTTNTDTKTNVHVPDKHFLVLSGMISDNKTANTEQVPCLGGIPLLGNAFKKKSNNHSKKSTLIFIRPQIIETEKGGTELTNRQKEILKEYSDNDEFSKHLDSTLKFLDLEFKD